MIALLQRVSQATVVIERAEIARIGAGLLALIGITPSDDVADALRLLDRILRYRMFADVHGKMNLNLQQVSGDLLLVPQFTLAADTRHGLRPSFATAAPPAQARRLFEELVSSANSAHARVQWGRFGAAMQVSLINDGPVTFWMES